jgi:hypothetical protein
MCSTPTDANRHQSTPTDWHRLVSTGIDWCRLVSKKQPSAPSDQDNARPLISPFPPTTLQSTGRDELMDEFLAGWGEKGFYKRFFG